MNKTAKQQRNNSKLNTKWTPEIYRSTGQVMSWEEVCARVPCVKITHIPAARYFGKGSEF